MMTSLVSFKSHWIWKLNWIIFVCPVWLNHDSKMEFEEFNYWSEGSSLHDLCVPQPALQLRPLTSGQNQFPHHNNFLPVVFRTTAFTVCFIFCTASPSTPHSLNKVWAKVTKTQEKWNKWQDFPPVIQHQCLIILLKLTKFYIK